MTQNTGIRKKEWIVTGNGRQIYGVLYIPEGGTIKGGVILSHGYNGSHEHFDRECSVLAENGYYAYAYDFCGGSANGLSRGLETTEMTLFTEKEDLLAVFDAVSGLEPLQGKEVCLLGGSQGGCVTALAAAELKERAARVVLYYPALMIPDNWRETYKTTEEIPEVTDFWGMKLGRIFFTSMHDFSTYDHIGAYQNPVLILHGDRDEIVPMDVAEKAAEILPDAKLIVLEGEGHGFTAEGTEKALKCILDFLQ